MARRHKTLREFRREVADLARIYASERGLIGDPEGEGEFRDFAARVSRLRLTTNEPTTKG